MTNNIIMKTKQKRMYLYITKQNVEYVETVWLNNFKITHCTGVVS